MIFDRLNLWGKAQASTPIAGGSWGSWIGGGRAAAGINVTESSAMSGTAVWAALRVISDTISTVPHRAMERDGDSRKLRSDHPVDRLLHLEPNEEMSAQSFRAAMQSNALLWGNGYAEIARTGAGRPVELGNPIHPTLVTTTRDNAGRLVYEVRPDHTGALGGPNETVTIPARDMLHLKGPTSNGLIGHAILTTLKDPIGYGLALDRFGSTWFGNGARPSGFLKHPRTLSPEAQKNLVDVFHGKHGGPQNANKTAVLQEGVEWQQVSVAPEQAQFLQSRTFSITEVSRIFGVPPHMLAELSRATFSNIEHMAIEFTRHAIQPWAVRWEQETTRKLFDRNTESNMFTRMNLNSLVRADTKTRGEFYKTLWGIGGLSTNDILAMEDRNPIGPEGDQRFVPMNMVPLDQAGDLAASRSGGGRSGQAQATEPQPDVELQKTCCARTFGPTAEQLVKVECDRVSRKTDKPGFVAWADGFYAKQAEHWCKAFRGPVETLASFVALGCGATPADAIESMALAADTYINAHLEGCHDALMEAHADGSTDELLKLWATTRPARITHELTDKIADAIVMKAKATHEQAAPAVN